MLFFDINEKLLSLDKKVLEMTKPYFEEFERIAEYNSQKVLSAFIHNRVSEAHLGISTGYGYGDIGRDTLDNIVADCFGAEDALIRHSFASGTHTLSVALFGILRPGDKVLVITGRPYDTIVGVFGIDGKSDGSLADFGVGYDQVDLDKNGLPDKEAIKEKLKTDFYKMVYIQRSKGYS
ncbi:MAG: methionine gamma-lyase family protein, partial [Clostridia bacterium]|nr:methionine gamma-lyase family protein [Clostridia bacterium]